MKRKAKDPTLNALGAELKNLPIQHSLEIRERFQELDREYIRGHGWEFRNVNIMPDQQTWAVRLYLGGEQRRLGVTTCGITACRFADMALMHFWKYRIRGASEPLDTHLNFGVAQAKKDLEELSEHAFLLSKIENHLVISGVLPDEKTVSARYELRTQHRRAVEHRKTARSELLERFAIVERTLEQILKRLDGIACAIQHNQAVQIVHVDPIKDEDLPPYVGDTPARVIDVAARDASVNIFLPQTPNTNQ